MAESVRAKKSSEESDEEDRRPLPVATAATLEPDWSYNIGEAVLDIQPVTLSSFEVGIDRGPRREAPVLFERQLHVRQVRQEARVQAALFSSLRHR